jgi:hypothetical protein
MGRGERGIALSRGAPAVIADRLVDHAVRVDYRLATALRSQASEDQVDSRALNQSR